jgi:hypothetical protein
MTGSGTMDDTLGRESCRIYGTRISDIFIHQEENKLRAMQ